ncbi:hypothetical protein INR49_001519 [Caranx melampygus]|nr:hypothetical protein INR49_001519 [Caranx melampygus]
MLLIKALIIFLFLLGVHLARVRELVQEDVLAAAEAKLENVFFFELIVALGIDALVVQVGAVARAQVNDVRPHPATSGAVCTRTLSVNVHDWKGFIILERVQSPSAFGNASLRGLVVLDHNPSECVGIFRECPGQFKVGLLLLSRSSICIIRSSFRLSKSVFLVVFSLLVVFPAPLIVLLPLSLLGGERISFSVPVSTTHHDGDCDFSCFWEICCLVWGEMSPFCPVSGLLSWQETYDKKREDHYTAFTFTTKTVSVQMQLVAYGL